MSSRVSNSEMLRMQEARIDSLTLLVEKLTAMHGETMQHLAAILEARRTLPAETIVLGRPKVGEKVDVWDANFTRQEGESRAEFIAEATEHHERLCNRYPLSDGRTHVWPLDQGTDPIPPTLTEQLENSLPESGNKASHETIVAIHADRKRRDSAKGGKE